MTTPESTEFSPLQRIAISRKLLEAEILASAWEDDAFRAQLEADPASALREAGFPLPQGKALRVVREKPGTLTLALPAKPETGVEIADAELASVAGGGLRENGSCTIYDQISGKKDIRYDSDGRRTISDGEAIIARGILGGVAGLLSITGLSWGWG